MAARVSGGSRVVCDVMIQASFRSMASACTGRVQHHMCKRGTVVCIDELTSLIRSRLGNRLRLLLDQGASTEVKANRGRSLFPPAVNNCVSFICKCFRLGACTVVDFWRFEEGGGDGLAKSPDLAQERKRHKSDTNRSSFGRTVWQAWQAWQADLYWACDTYILTQADRHCRYRCLVLLNIVVVVLSS
jgi:hypothetical protein